MLRLALMSLLLAFALPAAAQSARVSMNASSNRVAVGEPFAIEIRIETDGDEADTIEVPDFGSLEVLGRSTARPFSFSFGMGAGGARAHVKSEIVYSFTLRARERGVYAIRPAVITVGKRRIASQPLNIVAVERQGGPGTAMPPAAGDHEPQQDGHPLAPPSGALDGATFDQTMFVRTVVDKKRAYVGEQVTVTVYLYLRGQLADSPAITREPTLEGFWSQDLLPMQRSLSSVRQEVNGRVFNAYVLRRFAAFPLRAGQLEVGPPSVEIGGGGGSIFDLLNGPSQPIRRNGVTVAIEALPLPAQPTRGAPTHTGALTLEAALDSNQVKVGEALTLRVTAKGRGNLRGLELPSPQLAGIEVLPPELDDEITAELDQIGGTRVARWLLLPRTAGAHTIPSFAVDVFDPATGRFSTVRTKPLKFTVTGESQAAPAPSEPSAPDLVVPRFGPVHHDSALLRRAPPLYARGFFWPSVAAAPLLLLAIAGLGWARRASARHRAGSRDAEAMREVEARLAKAEAAVKSGDARTALGLLAAALKGAVEARLQEPVGGLTMSALEAHLRARGMDDKVIGRVVTQLGALDRARFDPEAQGALQLSKATEGVRALIRELARVRLKPAPDQRRVEDRARESKLP